MLTHLRYLNNLDKFRYLINIAWDKRILIIIKRLDDNAPLFSSGLHINCKIALQIPSMLIIKFMKMKCWLNYNVFYCIGLSQCVYSCMKANRKCIVSSK